MRRDPVKNKVAIEIPFANWDLLAIMVAKVVVKGQGALAVAEEMEC